MRKDLFRIGFHFRTETIRSFTRFGIVEVARAGYNDRMMMNSFFTFWDPAFELRPVNWLY
jgi:hypothetical protein